MLVKIKIQNDRSWNQKRYSRPWIGIKRDGRYEFGKYDPVEHELSIEANPGEKVVFGQKDYRRPKRSLMVAVKVPEDGNLDIEFGCWGGNWNREKIAAALEGIEHEVIKY